MMDSTPSLPIYTIGHSTRTVSEFADMLLSARVTQLIDVRSIPRSRTNPQYNLDTLPATLAEYQLDHTYIRELGGRRPRQRSVAPELNSFWKNQSFHNYADYALSGDFQVGLKRLLELGRELINGSA